MQLSDALAFLAENDVVIEIDWDLGEPIVVVDGVTIEPGDHWECVVNGSCVHGIADAVRSFEDEAGPEALAWHLDVSPGSPPFLAATFSPPPNLPQAAVPVGTALLKGVKRAVTGPTGKLAELPTAQAEAETEITRVFQDVQGHLTFTRRSFRSGHWFFESKDTSGTIFWARLRRTRFGRYVAIDIGSGEPPADL